jgi:hypothetical protein
VEAPCQHTRVFNTVIWLALPDGSPSEKSLTNEPAMVAVRSTLAAAAAFGATSPGALLAQTTALAVNAIHD